MQIPCVSISKNGASQGGSAVENPPVNAEGVGSIPGSGRSSREANGSPLQCSCLENPVDGGTWQVTLHGVTESDITEMT